MRNAVKASLTETVTLPIFPQASAKLSANGSEADPERHFSQRKRDPVTVNAASGYTLWNVRRVRTSRGWRIHAICPTMRSNEESLPHPN